jgi:hypothetical protein
MSFAIATASVLRALTSFLSYKRDQSGWMAEYAQFFVEESA